MPTVARRSVARLIAPVLLLASFAVVGGAAAVSATTGSTPACAVGHFAVASTQQTKPGATTVALTLTSRFYPACQWSYRTGFQFLSANGAPVGPLEHATGTPTGTASTIKDTFVVDESVSTREGVRCTVEKATALELTYPKGTSLEIHLTKGVSVCVNGTTHWTTVSPPTFPVAPRCPTSALSLRVGPANGTAGTIFYPLIITNTSASACDVLGTPHVQPTTGSLANVAHLFVGPASRTVNVAGEGRVIRLAPRGRASANFGEVESGNFTPSACVAKDAQSLSIGFDGIEWWVAFKSTVCTKLASTTISGVVANVTGVAP